MGRTAGHTTQLLGLQYHAIVEVRLGTLHARLGKEPPLVDERRSDFHRYCHHRKELPELPGYHLSPRQKSEGVVDKIRLRATDRRRTRGY